MSSVTIRLYHLADEADCARIMAEAQQRAFHWADISPPSANDFRAAIADDVVLVAEGAGRVIGFAGIYRPDNFLHHLYVSTDHQRRGIGRLLLQQVHEMLDHRVTLKCQVQNEPARHFYRMQGWREDAQIGGVDAHGPWLWLRFDAGAA